MDQIQTWTWIHLAHVRPPSWQAVPWSVSNSFLSSPSHKAKHWQYDRIFHHGISQWCYSTWISEWEYIELQEILHRSSTWAVIDKYLPTWARPSCPLRRGSSGKLSHLPCLFVGPGLVSLPSPVHTSSNSFLSSCSSSFPKSHCNLVPKFTHRYCPKLLTAVKFLFSHPSQVLIFGLSKSHIQERDVSYFLSPVTPHHYLQWEIQQTKRKLNLFSHTLSL